MIIRALIRLQHCTTNSRRAFVPVGHEAHGIAKGEVLFYLVEGRSWAHIRRVLKTFDVIGHSNCNANTVDVIEIKDIGVAIGSLKRAVGPELIRQVAEHLDRLPEVGQ